MEILRKIPGEPSTLEGFLTRTISHLNFTGIKMQGDFCAKCFRKKNSETSDYYDICIVKNKILRKFLTPSPLTSSRANQILIQYY